MQADRCNVLIMHGWGATYLEAAERLRSSLAIESFWHHGRILVPARSATLLRHLLHDRTEDPCYQALCKLIISRFLSSPPLPQGQRAQLDPYSSFAEDRLRRAFPQLGIPFAPAARQRRAIQLAAEAEAELQPLLQILETLCVQAAHADDELTEAHMRHLLESAAQPMQVAGSPIPLLETLRDMHETGGDLDSVASAVLYATALRQKARAKHQPFRYGHEYHFAFINYHESLQTLTAYAPADLYLADLPVAAFPALEPDIQNLKNNGINTVRFEDHHPYDPVRKQTLEKLVAAGALGYLGLSGPEQGAEQQAEERKCAADMVFESCIAGTLADTAAARRLREAAHGEDFVTQRTPLGVLLTDLIKGGICKVELAQILVAAMDDDTALERLAQRGWSKLPALWRSTLERTAETIRENTALLQLADGHTRILCAKAVPAETGSPHLPTGTAIAFLARTFPEAQYAFYCFGSALMVARRMDQADTTLNLGSIMSRIGTDSDGGHAGAAVCRPAANPRFPKRRLAHISDANFVSFARYLGSRLCAAGYPVATVRNLSQPGRPRWTNGSRKLVWVIVSALLTGLALLFLAPPFRPATVRASNADFFPQIDIRHDIPSEAIPTRENL